ncbi:MOSC domain-containing protein [Variovorax boronicumulans]|uniref:MOSC domain-containing protein n=1 Tax=Variovorax boronicumulans TaxID=436515 RepID=UPI00085CAE63|nr:MOSC domain-containing protein [Variovorax boronicumulans]OEZ32761.1 hypothetical protein AO062_00315 [Variovorax boronicumulans]
MTQPALPIDALLVGPVALLPDGRTRSGIRKTPTADALWLSPTGLQGDAQADLRIHGGVEKAVHHYPREHYAGWAAGGHHTDLLAHAGAFGENISTTGWDESTVCIGDVVQLGDARFAPEWEQAAALPALAERWRATFRKRVDAGRVEDWEPRLRAPASDP